MVGGYLAAAHDPSAVAAVCSWPYGHFRRWVGVGVGDASKDGAGL
jgi:hypothetical protein